VARHSALPDRLAPPPRSSTAFPQRLSARNGGLVDRSVPPRAAPGRPFNSGGGGPPPPQPGAPQQTSSGQSRQAANNSIAPAMFAPFEYPSALNPQRDRRAYSRALPPLSIPQVRRTVAGPLGLIETFCPLPLEKPGSCRAPRPSTRGLKKCRSRRHCAAHRQKIVLIAARARATTAR